MSRLLVFLVAVLLLANAAAQPVPKDSKIGPFANRSGKAKEKSIEEFGGDTAGEKSIALALEWFAKQQAKDGSWTTNGDNGLDSIAGTGLALLAYLGAGETHKDSKKYKKTVQTGLNYLTKKLPLNGKDAGKFTNTVGFDQVYGQAIATLALCEAYGMTRDKDLLLKPAQAAINYIQKLQARDGSWGLEPTAPIGSTWILGWYMQALHAAQWTKDIKVDDAVIAKAIKFLDATAEGDKKSKYRITATNAKPAEPGTSATAVGLLGRMWFDGWDAKNAGLTEGVEGFLNRRASDPDHEFFHIATLTLREYGGDAWKTWSQGPKKNGDVREGGVRDLLLLRQKESGSWPRDRSYVGQAWGDFGTTATAVLVLEAPYRHLPVLPAEPKKP